MSRRAWLNLILLLAVVALAAVVYFEPGKQQAQSVRLTRLDPANVQRITLVRPTGKDVVLQRREGAWYVIEPVAVAAQTFQVEKLLELLAQESLQQYPARGLDPSKYGLQPPRAQLTLDGVELVLGKINPLNKRRYVLVNDVMHMVAPDDISLLTGDWSAFVSTALLPNAPLARLELPGLGRLERGDGGWGYEGDAAPASADQMQMLVDAWQHVQALRVRPLQAVGGAQQALLQLVSGAELRFVVKQSDEGLVLQRRDIGLEYVFDASQARRLLAWPPPAGAENEAG